MSKLSILIEFSVRVGSFVICSLALCVPQIASANEVAPIAELRETELEWNYMVTSVGSGLDIDLYQFRLRWKYFDDVAVSSDMEVVSDVEIPRMEMVEGVPLLMSDEVSAVELSVLPTDFNIWAKDGLYCRILEVFSGPLDSPGTQKYQFPFYIEVLGGEVIRLGSMEYDSKVEVMEYGVDAHGAETLDFKGRVEISESQLSASELSAAVAAASPPLDELKLAD